MVTFILIVTCTVLLGLGLLGAGRGLMRTTSPAVAGLGGWTGFVLLCAAAWFFSFPAMFLAPVVFLLLLGGWWHLVRQLRAGEILAAGLVSALIAAVFALPFLRIPNLLAYASWGTDQWGYIGVARWLTEHSFDQLPVIDNKPGRDWIWYVLTVRDRPLLYEVLAMIAVTFRLDASLAYYVLPAALCAAVAHAFLLHDFPAGGLARAGRTLACLGIALQPLLLLHIQYQFLGGAVAGLAFMVLIVALFQFQAKGEEEGGRFYAVAVLWGVLMAGLYTVKITIVVLLIVGLAGMTRLLLDRRPGHGWRELIGSRRNLMGFVVIMIIAGLSLMRIRMLLPEPWSTPPVNGQAGHVWMQFGAIFGLTDIMPWYVPDNTPGTDPVGHAPAGGRLGAWLLGIFLLFYAGQCWRWFRQARNLTPAILLAALGGVAYFAAPPHGSHWNISRALPVFGAGLIVAVAATTFLRPTRWWHGVVLAAACLPLLRAAPKLWPYFANPACKMVEGEWSAPPEPFVWGALGYAYFYEDKEAIDWTKAPECFRAMTHYMPEELRPRLPETAKPDNSAP